MLLVVHNMVLRYKMGDVVCHVGRNEYRSEERTGRMSWEYFRNLAEYPYYGIFEFNVYRNRFEMSSCRIFAFIQK
jgi:hypothetical protein